MSKNEIILKIENLFSVYNLKEKNSFVAIKNFSHDFRRNKIYCIIGESGSGKSTLINYFNGLSKPIFGKITINKSVLKGKYNLTNLIVEELELKNFNINIPKEFQNKKLTKILIHTLKDATKINLKIVLKQYELKDPLFIKKIKITGSNEKVFLVIFDNKINLFNINKNITTSISETSKKTKNHKYKKKIKNYKEIRKFVGIVYQFPEYQLFKSTIIDDVMFGPLNLGFKKPEAKLRAQETLIELGILPHTFNSSPFNLSGGQKRRVAISGILSIGTDILVFDEPTAGLDPKGESEMLKIIASVKNKSKTAIVVTHSMDNVLEIADELLLIHSGEKICCGTPYEVFKQWELLEQNCIKLPKVIETIQQLVKIDKRFNKLYDYEPKNINELAISIEKILK